MLEVGVVYSYINYTLVRLNMAQKRTYPPLLNN
jgi:hypothetical protein